MECLHRLSDEPAHKMNDTVPYWTSLNVFCFVLFVCLFVFFFFFFFFFVCFLFFFFVFVFSL